jgi:PAS domain S-box-containing protein
MSPFVGLPYNASETMYTGTTLETSKDQYRWIVEVSHEGIALVDSTNRITFVNASLAYMLGYTVDEMLGLPVNTFIYSKDGEVTAEQLAAGRTGAAEQFELELRRKDGSIILGLLNTNPCYDDKGQFTGALAMVSDLTEHRQAIEERHQRELLEAQLKQEREIIEFKERFTSMVSHEFRSPLAAITLSAHMLEDYRDRLTPEQSLRKLHHIQQEAHQMVEILEDVLAFTKVRAGTPELNMKPLDMEAWCQDLLKQVQLTETTTHMFTLINNVNMQTIYVDEKCVRHILTNLLSNAIKYSPQGGVISLQIGVQADSLIFKVQDEGIGIPVEDQKRLFEPFHRARNTEDIAGTGLGLAIVKAVVDKCSGSIAVDSQVNKGTVFTVRLPLCNQPFP